MKKLPDLMIDLLKEDDLWNDLFKIISDYNDEHVEKFIDKLAQVRNINKDTDASIIDASIRQLGFDIHACFMEANGDNIRSGFYQLSKFYQINGTFLYPRFIEFILNRGFRLINLYTNDYVNFYPRPLGTLITDGGDWFPTSHVDIAVSDGADVQMFELVINEGDTGYIRKANGYDSMSAVERHMFDEALDAVRGVELDYYTGDPRFTRSLFRKRISDLFYRFAPIQEVIRNIYIARFASADLYISMSALKHRRMYVAAPPSIKSIDILLPTKVSANNAYGSLKGVVTWANDAQTMADLTDVSDSSGLIIDADNMIFHSPQTGATQETTVSAKYIDFNVSKNVTVFLSAIDPDSVVINAPRVVYRNTRSPVWLDGVFEEGRNRIEAVDAIEWEVTGPAELIDGELVVGNIGFDANILIKATYTTVNGVELKAMASVQAVANFAERTLVSLTQSLVLVDDGPRIGRRHVQSSAFEVIQGQTYEVETVATYSDESFEFVDATIEPLTDFIEVQAKRFIAGPAIASYPFMLRASFSDNGVDVTTVEQYSAKRVENILESISIQCLPTMLEGTRQIVQAIGTWADGARSYLSGITWSSADILDADGRVHSIAISPEGIIDAPIVNSDTRFYVRARLQRPSDGMVIEGTTIITVLNVERSLDAVDILAVDNLPEGYVTQLQFFGRWNNGSLTQLMPDIVNITERATGNVIATASLVNDVMEFASLGTQVNIRNSGYVFTDLERGIEFNGLEIAHDRGDTKYSGLFDIMCEYILDPVQDFSIVSSMPMTIVPRVKQLLNIQHNLPKYLKEHARYFVTIIGTFDSGEVEAVLTNLSLFTEDGSSDVEDLPVDTDSRMYTLDDIVYSLIGTTRDDLYNMSLTGEDLSDSDIERLTQGEPFFTLLENRPSSAQTWPQMLSILLIRYDNVQFARSLIQTRTVDDDEPFVLEVEVGEISIMSEHAVVDTLPEVINVILSRYIRGPVEIPADHERMFSYSLVVDYDDGGEEYAVSNDWEIELYSDDTRDERREIIRYLVDVEGKVELLPMSTDGSNTRVHVDDLTLEDMLAILPTSDVIDIDQNGYIYPKMNIETHAVIKALYNDGISKFEETLDIYTTKINQNMLGMDMFLLSPTEAKTYDFGNLVTDEANPWSETYNNTQRYQFAVELRLVGADDPAIPTGVVEWRAEPVGPGISFDQASGRLYVAPQSDDSDVTLVASYTQEFRADDTSSQATLEKVESRYVVRVYAHTALDDIQLTGPNYSLDNTVFYPTVRIRRRDGSYANFTDVLSWEVISGDPRITREGAYGFVIPSMTVDSKLVLRAVAREGMREITSEFEFNIFAGFIPEDLLVQYNPTSHKDNSVIQLKALLKLRNNAIPVDVTDKCYWHIASEGYGVSVTNREGTLTIPYAVQDYTAVVRCIYTRDAFRQEKTIDINVESSYPFYWNDPITPINSSYLASKIAGERTILPSTEGGRILLITNSDEYVYFATPIENGKAKFSLVPSKVDIGDWGNMMEPVNVVRTYTNGDTQDWQIYRSNTRGLGHIELSVIYTR